MFYFDIGPFGIGFGNPYFMPPPPPFYGPGPGPGGPGFYPFNPRLRPPRRW